MSDCPHSMHMVFFHIWARKAEQTEAEQTEAEFEAEAEAAVIEPDSDIMTTDDQGMMRDDEGCDDKRKGDQG